MMVSWNISWNRATHPFLDGILPQKSHPAIGVLGYHHGHGNPHICILYMYYVGHVYDIYTWLHDHESHLGPCDSSRGTRLWNWWKKRDLNDLQSTDHRSRMSIQSLIHSHSPFFPVLHCVCFGCLYPFWYPFWYPSPWCVFPFGRFQRSLDIRRHHLLKMFPDIELTSNVVFHPPVLTGLLCVMLRWSVI